MELRWELVEAFADTASQPASLCPLWLPSPTASISSKTAINLLPYPLASLLQGPSLQPQAKQNEARNEESISGKATREPETDMNTKSSFAYEELWGRDS